MGSAAVQQLATPSRARAGHVGAMAMALQDVE